MSKAKTKLSRYTPHSGQLRMHRVKSKEKWMQCARRWGKGRFAFGELMDAYGEWQKRPFSKTLVPGFHAWIVLPTFAQARQAWHELTWLMPDRIVQEIARADWMIYLRGAHEGQWGLIELKSAHDPESLQTVGLDFLQVSESQDVSNDAIAKLRPTLRSPGRLGRAVFEGIPATYSDHWFQRGFELGKRKPNRKHVSFHATVYDNPMLTDVEKAEVEEDKEILPDKAWRRMYLAEFSEGGGFFQNVDSCVGGDLLVDPIPGLSYVAGLDIGISRDFTVLIVMDSESRQVVYHQFWDSTPWPQVRAHINEIHAHWNIQRLVADATGMGQAMVQEFVADGMNVEAFQIVGENRSNLLGKLAVALERETLHFPSIPLLLRQLRAFQYRRTKTGMWKAEAPAGEHDDEVFSLALALTACNDAPLKGGGRIKGNGRYLPTQEEVGQGRLMSEGARMMKERKIMKIRDRAEKIGVEV